MSLAKRSARSAPLIICNEGLTRPEFKAQCTPRLQVERFIRDGVCFRTPVPPQFGDFTSLGSYQECLDRVLAIDSHFMSLPSAVRAKFSNDPASLMSFISDSKNRDEAIKLGLIAEKLPSLDEKIGAVFDLHFPPKEEKV